MKIDQKIKQLSTGTLPPELAGKAVIYSTRTIQTNIVVNSNDTAVLGGLMEDKENESIVKVPILGDIPILGWLFKSKTTEKKKKNLLVFITPKIIRNSQDNSDLVNNKLNERIDFVQQNMKGRDPHGNEVDKLPRRALVEEATQEYIGEPTVSPNEINGATEEPGTEPQPEEGLPGDFEEGE
jgi:general secretion pathway protein D